MSLMLTVSMSAGDHLVDALVEMGALANRIGCAVEADGNDTKFLAYPGDTEAQLREAYDRLYAKATPSSAIVAVHISKPVRRS